METIVMERKGSADEIRHWFCSLSSLGKWTIHFNLGNHH